MSASGWGSVKWNSDQWPIIKAAIEKVRLETDQPDLSYSRCLELIAADFLAGILP